MSEGMPCSVSIHTRMILLISAWWFLLSKSLSTCHELGATFVGNYSDPNLISNSKGGLLTTDVSTDHFSAFWSESNCKWEGWRNHLLSSLMCHLMLQSHFIYSAVWSWKKVHKHFGIANCIQMNMMSDKSRFKCGSIEYLYSMLTCSSNAFNLASS